MGFALAYERLQRFRDDDEKLHIDAWLGLPGARERLDRQRMDAVTGSGIEVG